MDALREMIIRHEGYRKKLYRCPAQKWTIGVGHNCESNPLPQYLEDYLEDYGEITDAMVMELLNRDIEVAIEDCRHLYHRFDYFSENRRNALVDFLFNVGFQTAKKFVNANKAINEERWEDAAWELTDSLWYRQVGMRSREIVRMVREG